MLRKDLDKIIYYKCTQLTNHLVKQYVSSEPEPEQVADLMIIERLRMTPSGD